jgi:hypothetical protein
LTQQLSGGKIDKELVLKLKNALIVDDRDFEAGRLLLKPRLSVYGSGEDGDRT